MITKLELYGIVALLMALACGAAYLKGHHAGAQEVQEKFDLFTAQVRAEGEKAKADALQKEKDYATQITVAVTSRDDALKRMQLAEARANAARRAMPLTPASTSAGGAICFDQKALSSAVEQYRGRVSHLVEQGDEAQLDAQTLVKSWPTQPQAKP
jgi:hypothetical protein